jgi:hypothetical protein
MVTSAASHSRAAVAAMVASTRGSAVGDSLIARSTSAVAVCSSSRSCSSEKSRAFSIAITAWSAKVSSRRTWSAVKGRTS